MHDGAASGTIGKETCPSVGSSCNSKELSELDNVLTDSDLATALLHIDSWGAPRTVAGPYFAFFCHLLELILHSFCKVKGYWARQNLGW